MIRTTLAVVVVAALLLIFALAFLLSASKQQGDGEPASVKHVQIPYVASYATSESRFEWLHNEGDMRYGRVYILRDKFANKKYLVFQQSRAGISICPLQE